MSKIHLITDEWINIYENDVEKLFSSKVVLIYAFQMLCPACVIHGVPLVKKLHDFFNPEEVSIIGLHTVFEHHEVMNSNALKTFIYEFRLTFPIAIDRASENNNIPQTMRNYNMQGTPSFLLFDKNGELSFHGFGQVQEIFLSSAITNLALNNQDNKIKIFRKGVH